MSDPSHLTALADAVTGRMTLGSHTQLIPEANDAARTNTLVVDGLSGDVNFPYGMLKPLVTVGEINMCEENHGDVVRKINASRIFAAVKHSFIYRSNRTLSHFLR